MEKSHDHECQHPAHGPLAGVRVIDITSVVLGPIATQILGDMGADVIKIEPLNGDLMRANGVSRNAGMSSIFLSLNRNKRSFALDLKSVDGAGILRRLIPTADVVVHNMRVAAVERLGFGYQAVKKLKADIVYCVATGFGQSGPDRDKPAFDDIIQAACGLADLNSAAAGEPSYVPSLIADKTTGMVLVNAVLAALFCRERNRIGQYVEVPMFETMVSFILAEHLGGLTFDPATSGAGYTRLLDGGRKPGRTKDGHMAILPYTGAHWRAFFKVAGRDDLAAKYGVDDRQARNANLVAMYRDMLEIMALRTTAEWLEVCASLDIPATPVYSLNDLTEHPQAKAVGLLRSAQHRSEGPIRYVRPTTEYSVTPSVVSRHAPLLGEHTKELLDELGYDGEEILTFVAKKIVSC
ncbi:MAG: crotonobetainyl-CoA:carnitine CoA-transferase CaiB-like acyl-CoA transferase [Gammaproteobacteria bacterium]|jgi:crotonobetainyl-CoA:carnitine CoA-transferase CaiB-like acyl-CoA transferase